MDECPDPGLEVVHLGHGDRAEPEGAARAVGTGQVIVDQARLGPLAQAPDGFRDADFSAARNTEQGFYAAVRIKFDANTMRGLGLGRDAR